MLCHWGLSCALQIFSSILGLSLHLCAIYQQQPLPRCATTNTSRHCQCPLGGKIIPGSEPLFLVCAAFNCFFKWMDSLLKLMNITLSLNFWSLYEKVKWVSNTGSSPFPLHLSLCYPSNSTSYTSAPHQILLSTHSPPVTQVPIQMCSSLRAFALAVSDTQKFFPQIRARTAPHFLQVFTQASPSW